MSACNPACSSTETCVVQGGAATCVANATDGGADVVDATTPDVEQPDVTQPDVPQADTTPPTDVPPPMDMAPVDGGRPACGMTGQPCCNRYACSGNNFCSRSTMRCEAFTPEADECTTTATCATGLVCRFGERCSGGERACLRCLAPVSMGAAEGASCVSAVCAGGVCAPDVCRAACVPGAAGDAACRAINPRYFCSEFSSTFRNTDGGLAPVTLLGACVPGCQRNADCSGTTRCGMVGQGIPDTLTLYCRAPFGRLTSGMACPLTPTSDTDPMQYCESGQCFNNGMSMTMGNCSAYCATDADCPSVFPHCRDIPFTRPSGMGSTVPIRMCDR